MYNKFKQKIYKAEYKATTFFKLNKKNVFSKISKKKYHS